MNGLNRLRRSRRHKMIAGVCGGMAEYLGLSPNGVRIVYVLVSVLSAAFPGILVYILLWLLLPKAEEPEPEWYPHERVWR